MRAVSAVLRIAREQLASRGAPRTTILLTFLFPIMAVGLLGIANLMPPKTTGGIDPMQIRYIAYGFIAFGIIYFLSNNRRQLTSQHEQQRAISVAAAASLHTILQTPFERRPLTREQVDTLRSLMRLAPDPAVLRDLMEKS